MLEFISLQGPIEKINGELVLMIPLEAGGDELAKCSRGISEIDGEFLKIKIPEWLALQLRVQEGSTVSVDNENGKFNIHSLDPYRIQ